MKVISTLGKSAEIEIRLDNGEDITDLKQLIESTLNINADYIIFRYMMEYKDHSHIFLTIREEE